MNRVFHSNFDLEEQLRGDANRLSADAARRVEELSTVWLGIAEDSDILPVSGAFDRRFFESLGDAGLPRLRPVTAVDAKSQNKHFCPWGWSSQCLDVARRNGWCTHAPQLDAVMLANSRRFSTEFELRHGLAIAGTAVVETANQLREHLKRAPPEHDKWIVKSGFGMSGREQIRGVSPDPTSKTIDRIVAWIRRDGCAVVEPMLSPVAEVGLQFEIPAQGSTAFIGAVELMTDRRGAWLASRIVAGDVLQRETPLRGGGCSGRDTGRSRPDRLRQVNEGRDDQWWSSAVGIGFQVADELRGLGYFGPVGIDGMQYCAPQGELRLRPVQDVNARYTMGRMSLGFRRLLGSGEQAEWQRFRWPAETTDQERTAAPLLCPVFSTNSGFCCQRSIITSPRFTTFGPARYGTALLIGRLKTED